MTRRERSSARTWAGTSTVIPLVARRELWPSLAGPTGAKLCVHDHGLAWEIGRERSPHGQFGTHLSRGAIYYIAYRWNGREYRESTRSTERRVAERLLWDADWSYWFARQGLPTPDLSRASGFRLEMARRKGTLWQREKGPLCRVVVATWPDGAERREATSGRVPINAFSSVERGPSGSVGRP